jgi:hypothetical protein
MSVRLSSIHGGDRERFYGLIRQVVETSALDVNIRDVARQTMDRVEGLATGAEKPEDRVWAVRLLRALAEDGARGHVNTVLKEARTAVVILWDGSEEHFSIPARVAIRDRQRKTWQHHFYDALPWDTYDGYVSGLQKGVNTQTLKLAAHQKILALRQQFPSTATPGQAMELAGMDPDNLELAG